MPKHIGVTMAHAKVLFIEIDFQPDAGAARVVETENEVADREGTLTLARPVAFGMPNCN